MSLTNREEQLLHEIREWEQTLDEYDQSQIEISYDEWLHKAVGLVPEHILQEYLAKTDDFMFHFTSFIQNTDIQIQAEKQIINTARVFQPDITDIPELQSLQIDQLSYICDQQLAKQRLYALGQGALSGTGKALLVGTDIPALLFINLQSIQKAAMSYGYNIHTPFELMMTLKVFHTALLPPELQKTGWLELTEEIEHGVDPYFYEGRDQVVTESLVYKAVAQIVKSFLIVILKRKAYGRIPLLGMAIGGGMNYTFTKQVTDYAKRFYQYRLLIEKVNNEAGI